MMKVVFLLGIVALLAGCNSIQKDEFVITGTISSYPKEVLICAYQTNGNFILDTIRVENGVTGRNCRNRLLPLSYRETRIILSRRVWELYPDRVSRYSWSRVRNWKLTWIMPVGPNCNGKVERGTMT